jgi:hypothetical protein
MQQPRPSKPPRCLFPIACLSSAPTDQGFSRLRGVARHCLVALRPVGQPRRVAEIDEALMRQLRQKAFNTVRSPTPESNTPSGASLKPSPDAYGEIG